MCGGMLTRQDRDRYLRAHGRAVDVEEFRLDYDPRRTHRLTAQGGNPPGGRAGARGEELNGPEFTGRAFTGRLAELGLVHYRIPARSPNHNAVVERFQGTVLAEFYRPHFHRVRIDTLAELDTPLQTWTADYNRRRRNRGDYMRGRTPGEMMRRFNVRKTA